MLFRYALYEKRRKMSFDQVIEWIRSNFPFYQQMQIDGKLFVLFNKKKNISCKKFIKSFETRVSFKLILTIFLLLNIN